MSEGRATAGGAKELSTPPAVEEMASDVCVVVGGRVGEEVAGTMLAAVPAMALITKLNSYTLPYILQLLHK